MSKRLQFNTMGRVAKYKKVKSFDPYSSKNRGNVNLNQVGIWGLGDSGRKTKKRSRRAEQLRSKNKKKRVNNLTKNGGGFDLPPTEREDEFDLNDLMGSVKKQKIANPNDDDHGHDDNITKQLPPPTATKGDRFETTGNSASIATTGEEEEKKVARLLKLEEHDIEKAEKQKLEQEMFQRQAGESKNAYRKRTKNETRQIIQQSHMKQHNPEKRQRKKEFLTNKKKQKKSSSASSSSNSNGWNSNGGDSSGGWKNRRSEGQQDNDDYDSDDHYNKKVNKDIDETRIVFGEQVERPPVFRQLPRGATATKQNKKRSKNNKFKQENTTTTTTTATKSMTEEEIDAERHAMDTMRRKIQAQYAAIKLSRRQNGDFHL